MRFEVTYLDGAKVEVVCTASARIAFEKGHDMAIPMVVGTGQSWWAYELAHASLAQTAGEQRSYDEWIDTVETVLWERPAAQVLAVANLFGYRVPEAEREAIEASTVDPTAGAAKAPSRAGSSKRHSPSAEAPES